MPPQKNLTDQMLKNTENQKDTKPLPSSFLGKSGRFYVACPEGWAIEPRYTAYVSPESYDTRTGLIGFFPATDAILDFEREIKIYPETLTVSPPVYPADRDETDYGLTPAQNLWAERFLRVREGQGNAI